MDSGERIAQMATLGRWKDRWLSHPFPNMSEPEKAVCYLTDLKDYDDDHLAWLYNKASLHAIDCFFMQVRRRLSPSWGGPSPPPAVPAVPGTAIAPTTRKPS
jgi:hypothetical protein